MGLNWYVIYTKSRHGQRVYNRLNGRVLELFLPKIALWSRRKDRRKRILQPLFPGYLFVREYLNKDKHLEILTTPSVVKILGNGEGCPAVVPDIQIESVKKILKADVLVEYYPFLKVGNRVRVIDGSLKGAEGILSYLDPQKPKLVVTIDILSRSVAVKIDSALVERC